MATQDADLLLIAAEAAYHTNNTGIAVEYLGQVRQRAKLNVDNGLSGNALLNAIYKERRSELAFEGHRLFDLRRTKQLNQIFGTLGSFVTYNLGGTDFYETSNKREKQDKGVKYTANKHELWPIPQDELNRRRGLRQNPGY